MRICSFISFKESYVHLFGERWLLLFFLFALQAVSSQSINPEFIELKAKLVQDAPKTYTEIHAVMRPYRNDTILMKDFAAAAAESGYLAGQSYALNELGRRYRNLTQYTKAIALHNRALEVASKADNIELKVSSYNNLGVVYRRTSSIRTAMDYNQKALELAETVENPSKGLKRGINVALNCVGNLYQTLEQYDEAISYFRRSMKLEAELGNKLGLAINYQNLGECFESQGELGQAMDNYLVSLSYNDEIDNDMGRVICKTGIAQVFIKQGRPEEALELMKTNLPLAEKVGDGFLISPAHITLGWAQMILNQNKEAEKSFYKGLQLAEKNNILDMAAKASYLLSGLYERMGNFEKSLFYNRRAVQLNEDILNESTVRYVNDIIYRYDYEKKNSKIDVLEKQNEIGKLKLRQNQTTLWISGIVLALMAGIFYVLYRQFQLKNEKKVLTLEQDMLRSQMNPHFLFNSLNSIKLYIINNEQKNAVHYLNKFSKLVRKILEASSVKEIALADELETVELYMNIEDIRFSNEINFNIIIQEDIDPQLVKIPSLILQPFLENALWHGLSSKEGEKKIDLHVSKTGEGSMTITITDNGIGREAAEKIKKGKVLKRKSVGIDITKERLANFAKEYKNPFSLNIVDLYDEQQRPSGTSVVLIIPTV